MFIGNLVVVDEEEINEVIPDYFKTFDEYEKRWSRTEEESNRNLLGGMKLLSDDQFNNVKECNQEKEFDIIGTHTYNILANKKY